METTHVAMGSGSRGRFLLLVTVVAAAVVWCCIVVVPEVFEDRLLLGTCDRSLGADERSGHAVSLELAVDVAPSRIRSHHNKLSDDLITNINAFLRR